MLKNFIHSMLKKYNIDFKEAKAGREVNFRCPFHDDRRASMGMNTINGKWNCFSCPAGGDSVISFIKNLTGEHIEMDDILTPGERVKYTIETLYEKSVDNIFRFEDNLKFAEVIRETFKCFIPALQSAAAVKYLKDKRRFTDTTIKRFRLQYATSGEYQGRIIIPYFHNGIIVGFNSRLIGVDKGFLKGMRYRYFINHHEFETYVYNMDGVVSDDFCILVEGPFDLMYVVQCGFKNVISTLTTNVSFKHLESLTRFEKIIFCFDNDKNGAGNRGVMTAAAKIMQTMQDKQLFFVKLPAKSDPNDCTPETLKECFSKPFKLNVQRKEPISRLQLARM